MGQLVETEQSDLAGQAVPPTAHSRPPATHANLARSSPVLARLAGRIGDAPRVRRAGRPLAIVGHDETARRGAHAGFAPEIDIARARIVMEFA
jgi:hypothetical protein